ncbi:hypothetical protein E1262_01935 [Jiangella aurantiaca]|uniref:Fibronectin type-III domain-containing protein n=1 Tax=Jiangella aurantiaca TaxID=2530373 RepID=A0A4R5AJ27_9ACTN|nr:hypothetical protein [Jiangella aurantiaca]TDD72643.1 hypothetical protein E1262_01935 [Jiangella aurantiaca]
MSSNVVTVTTPPATDTVAPTAPTNLRETTAGCEEAWLTWNASSDDADPASSLRYDVYVNGVRQPVDSHSPISHTSTVADAAAPGLNTFVVRAVDTSGNISPPSNPTLLRDRLGGGGVSRHGQRIQALPAAAAGCPCPGAGHGRRW